MHRPGTKLANEALGGEGPSERPDPLRLEGTALFLDLDGVLAPIVAHPQDVRPDARRTELMQALHTALGGRLAVISGRTIEDLDRILGGAVPALAGIHGLERRSSDGRLRRAEPSKALDRARAAFAAVEREWPGAAVEEKTLSVGIHFRAAPDAYAAVCEAIDGLTPSDQLVVQWGQMVAELRTPGATKGDALTAFMAEPPFIGSRPIFLGDDLTDEYGFLAAQASGGLGVLVGRRRDSAATTRLADVEAVYDWLGAALANRGAA